jgi:hypothetical protein
MPPSAWTTSCGRTTARPTASTVRPWKLAEPPSTSGIDAWGKSVRYPFMTRQLRTGDQHAYHGEGIDYYNVGTFRGAGGLGVWDGGKLWVSRNWKSYKILKDGPDAASFKVDYAPWQAGASRKVWESRTFTLPMGTNFTRLVSTFQSDKKGPLTVASASPRSPPPRPRNPERRQGQGRGDLLGRHRSGQGDHGPGPAAGSQADRRRRRDRQRLAGAAEGHPGKPFVYYMGAAWDKGLDFHSRAEWEAYVQAQKPSFDPAK